MKGCFTFFLIFVWLWSNASVPEDSTKSSQWKKSRWYIPHYFPLQYAGNIGFLSAGVGYGARKDNYQLSLVYGYAPPSVAGVRIHTVTAKNIFHLYRFYLSEKRTLIPYVGLGLSFELGGHSFFTLPKNMPDGYYHFPKSVHLVASGGVKLRYMTNNSRTFRGFEFFAEACTIDAYIWYKFLSEEVKMGHILSLALGVHFLRK
jgi:hypothetical protein